MPISSDANKVLRLPSNTEGRDFIVGDIHGCYQAFQHALELLGFHDNPANRMISVGDLIDRGPDSLSCANLIYELWFYAVQGNHEDLMIRSLVDRNDAAIGVWMGNGGSWFYNHDQYELVDLANALKQLPLVIVVGEGEDRYHVVHGEFKTFDGNPIDNNRIDNWDFDHTDERNLMWGRTIIYARDQPVTNYHQSVDLSITYVGHTPVQKVIQIERQVYVDTGAVFGYRDTQKSLLSFACPTDGKLYQYDIHTKELITSSLADIPKYRQPEQSISKYNGTNSGGPK